MLTLDKFRYEVRLSPFDIWSGSSLKGIRTTLCLLGAYLVISKE
jgi:hypothetical protein